MLPARGPWDHPYYSIEDAYLNVSFVDSVGETRRIGVRHKVTGDGPPIVLVHGLMTSSYSWRFVLEALGRRYRVFAPDLVGAGASDKPLELCYSVDNVARFLTAYVRTVSKDPVYLVGNSLGGLYALRAIMNDMTLVHGRRGSAEGGTRDETLVVGRRGSAEGGTRDGTLVHGRRGSAEGGTRDEALVHGDAGRPIARRFVLMHAPGYPLVRTRLLSSILHAPALGPAAAELVAQTAHRFPQQFIAKNVHYARSDMMSEEECAEYGRLFETLDGARVFAKILDESLDPAEHEAIIGELQRRAKEGPPLPCPVKLLYARKDVMVPPSFGPRYHSDIPGSELVWIDDASHFLHVDAPDRTVLEITSFDPPGAASATA